MGPYLRVLILALFVLSSVGGDAFEIAYFTTLRNGSDRSIDLDSDLESGHTHYTLAPGRSLTFLGGLSTVRFSIRTAQQTFYYRFPLSFGAAPTRHKGRQNHSYTFTRDHKIFPIAPDSSVVRDVRNGFPIVPLPK
jgi:hypothetical protein